MATGLARKQCIIKFQSLLFKHLLNIAHARTTVGMRSFHESVSARRTRRKEVLYRLVVLLSRIFSAFLSNYNFLITEIIVALSASNCLTCLPSRVTITKSFIRECTNVSVISRVFVASVRECIASVRHGNNYECYATDIMCYPDPQRHDDYGARRIEM